MGMDERRARLDELQEFYGEDLADAVETGLEIFEQAGDSMSKNQHADFVRAAMWSVPIEWLEVEVALMKNGDGHTRRDELLLRLNLAEVEL